MFTIVDQFGETVTLVEDETGELWYGSLIGRSSQGLYLVALHGPRTGEGVFARRERGV